MRFIVSASSSSTPLKPKPQVNQVGDEQVPRPLPTFHQLTVPTGPTPSETFRKLFKRNIQE